MVHLGVLSNVHRALQRPKTLISQDGRPALAAVVAVPIRKLWE